MKIVEDTCDPFAPPVSNNDSLINIATGRATGSDTKEYLLGAIQRGRENRIKFESECQNEDGRLLQRIPRTKVKNFAAETTKVKQLSKSDHAKKATEGLRDVFIRMIVIVAKRTPFDLRNLLKYPITQFPLSMVHSDGTPMKTPKNLESMQDGFDEGSSVDATLFDGGLLLHTYLSVAHSIPTYGSIARSVLSQVCSTAGQEIHVLFDTYVTDSIKGSERRLRGAEDRPFVIAGPEQTPRQSGQQLLKNGIFKEQLAIFLMEEWKKSHYGPILGCKTLVVSHGGNCQRYSFFSEGERMIVDRPIHLQGKHEEADTLIAFHAANMEGNIVVRASDTDVLVILVGMIGQREGTVSPLIIMDCGSGNCRRFINVNAITAALQGKRKRLASALPAIHAFTGCDFTSAFYRKGKVKPLELVENDDTGKFVSFFDRLGTTAEPEWTTASEFVCSLYGQPTLDDVDEARYARLVQMTGKIAEVC